MPNIGIRADGGPDVGMGHIMRCLSLAKELKNIGCTVCFISRTTEGIEKIMEAGFEAVGLYDCKISEVFGNKESKYDAICNEISEIINLSISQRFDCLIIDSYNISESYFLKLHPHFKKLVYIDDVNKFTYPVDILINGNITGEYLDYKKFSDNQLMLLGLKYNLIRDEFKDLPERIANKDVHEIILTTGGSDPFDLCSVYTDVLSKATRFNDLKINIIVGSSFQNKDKLHSLSNSFSNIVLHENVKSMSEIMYRSDIAISSGGSTLYELCACGTPTLGFVMADNQEFIVRKMDELGYISSLGWYNTLDAEGLVKQFESLLDNYELRIAYSKKMQTLVDGLGALRAANAILEVLKENR